MKPYYSEDGITIYHGDCREIAPALGECRDLIVTDPPYNCGKDYGTGTNDSRDDYIPWLIERIGVMEAACRGPVFVFLSVNGMLSVAAAKRPRHVCAWTKPMSFSPRQGGSPFLPHWEPCLIYGKTWGEGGRVPTWHLSDAWQFNTATKNGHPCPKPEGLMRKIIGSAPDGVVMDCFMGSGTTLRAAKDLGRRAIGIEIEERYCEIAAKRLAQRVIDFEAVKKTTTSRSRR